ncbi:DNA polymerase V subunit UmuD [Serratia sp. Leaf50]|nr:DNA polymerase V subunit UmuD [Serratia sp. Leaf50]
MNIISPALDASLVNRPLFRDHVPAGFPSPATDFVDKNIDLNDLCVKTPAATFFAIASGLSMMDAGIYEGSLLVIDRSLTAKHGDIVIASVAGEYTVKRLCLHPVVQLEPMNPDFPPIVLHDGGDDLELFGVVTFSINGLR